MPKKANIRYSEESLSDLAGIFEYIAEDSPARALDYIDKLSNTITNLQENPNIGVTCKRKLIRIDCRVLIVDAYLIFYRHDKAINDILIIRVLRDKQDYSKLLK